MSISYFSQLPFSVAAYSSTVWGFNLTCSADSCKRSCYPGLWVLHSVLLVSLGAMSLQTPWLLHGSWLSGWQQSRPTGIFCTHHDVSIYIYTAGAGSASKWSTSHQNRYLGYMNILGIISQTSRNLKKKVWQSNRNMTFFQRRVSQVFIFLACELSHRNIIVLETPH